MIKQFEQKINHYHHRFCVHTNVSKKIPLGYHIDKYLKTILFILLYLILLLLFFIIIVVIYSKILIFKMFSKLSSHLSFFFLVRCN